MPKIDKSFSSHDVCDCAVGSSCPEAAVGTIPTESNYIIVQQTPHVFNKADLPRSSKIAGLLLWDCACSTHLCLPLCTMANVVSCDEKLVTKLDELQLTSSTAKYADISIYKGQRTQYRWGQNIWRQQ
ncbi:hypothetical protein HZ326_2802 [Fusarium oxysporum f. sp. albedinis]|nr:hypothetical protein HZ326_2802 [Fusarium oxysporum f. sp. albedinis]